MSENNSGSDVVSMRLRADKQGNLCENYHLPKTGFSRDNVSLNFL